MFRRTDPPPARSQQRRRGAILIVVLALLALFAVIAISFVFLADAEATSARIYRETQSNGGNTVPPAPDPSGTMDTFLSALLFDVGNTNADMTNVLRGHGLVTTMYSRAQGSTGMFDGPGTFHESPGGGSTFSIDRAQFINYTAWRTYLSSAPGFQDVVMDPEWTGGIRTGGPTSPAPTLAAPLGRTFVPKNAGYTYPDLNNFYLAMLSPTTGEVLTPSFHRPWLFNQNNTNTIYRLAPWNPADTAPSTSTASNTDWVTPDGRARMLRPRPVDQLQPGEIIGAGVPYPIPPYAQLSGTQRTALYNLISNMIAAGSIIPYPSANGVDPTTNQPSYTGDLQNLTGANGVQKNDSMVLDIGLPPQQWNGMWIKPLIAPLIVDLDGRMNVNAAGNMKGNNTHTSFSGYGPWEQNLAYVLGSQNDANMIVSGRTGSGGPLSVAFSGVAVGMTPAPPTQVLSFLPFNQAWSQGLGTFIQPRLGQYTQVNWDGAGPNGAAPIQIPAFPSSQFQVAPAYFPLNWVASSMYQAGQRVQNSGNVYKCVTPGTSGMAGPTLTNLTDGSVQWAFVGPGFWQPGTPYSVNQQAINGVNVYQCSQAGTSAAPGPTGTSAVTDGGGVKWTYIGPMVFDDNTNPQKGVSHPALYNANYWASPTPGTALPANSPISYPLSDLKRLSYRYADTWDNYSQTSMAKLTSWPTTLLGPTTAPLSTALATYYANPANATRLLTTTLSAGFDRPAVMANFNTITPGSNTILSLQSNALHASQSTTFPGTFPFPPTGTTSGMSANLTDFTSNVDTRNQVAAFLGPVDLNRQLADYRDLTSAPNVTTMGTVTTQTPQPISASNMGNVQQAMTDRQNLAQSIFVRLAVTSGAAIFVNPTNGAVTLPQPAGAAGSGTYTLALGSGPPQTVTAQEYNALRYLAQIAANTVDYVDLDDVSTTFVWNPINPADPFNRNLDPMTNQPNPAMNSFASQQTVADRVVFGVEKPRLVINEAYGEIVNDPNDPNLMSNTQGPKNPAHVRFWVELMNPTASPYPSAGASSSLLNDGSVQLWNTGSTPYSPYRIVISRVTSSGGAASIPANLTDPSNVTGDVSLATSTTNNTVTPDVRFDFNCTSVTGMGGLQSVAPNNGTYNNSGGVTSGFVVAGPQFTPAGGTVIEWNPGTAGPWAAPTASGAFIQSNTISSTATSNAMGYIMPGTTPPASPDLQNYNNTADGLTRHVILLRRLANPYLQPNDPIDTSSGAYNSSLPPNPYITVDMMDYVPAWDAVRRGSGDTTDRSQKVSTPGPGYDPWGGNGNSPTQRASVGKVQPYAGFASAPSPAANNPYVLSTYPSSFVIPQNTSPAASTPRNTFFRHNGVNTTSPTPSTGTTVVPASMSNPNVSLGSDTIMAPFDWIVHLDRPVVNTLELFNLTSVKPHELTRYFLQTSQNTTTGDGARRDMPLVPWLGVTATGQPGFDTSNMTNPNSRTFNGLFRALDMVRVNPWGYGVGLGGRQYGRINVNTAADVSVVQGLLDPQPGNVFNATDVSNLWKTLFTSGAGARTVTTVTKTDGSGATHVVPVPGPTVDDIGSNTPPPGVSLLDRPFRAAGVGEYTPGGIVAQGGSGLQDTIFRVSTGTGSPLAWVGSQTQPYFQTEMARKMFNNATTVSNTFTIHATIVYYQVRTDPTTGNPLTDGGAVPRYLLGQEVYRQVPGDMRQQFFAVADRSNIGLTMSGGYQSIPFYTSLNKGPVPVTNAMGTTVSNSLYLPSVTQVNTSTQQLVVMADSQSITIGAGTALLVGSGANREVAVVSGINADGSLSVPVLSNTHVPGECISNVVPGNPGIPGQTAGMPAFDVLTNTNSPYRRVVPYITRTR